MFESLDSIDWESLAVGEDGPVAEVPNLLRSLLSPDEEIRDWATDELGDAVIHQGTVSEVSPLVIPFLFELLENDRTPDKVRIAMLLTELAQCVYYEETDAAFRRSLDESLREELGITYAESLRRQRESVNRVKRQIAERFHLIYSYIRYRGDFQVRISVVAALNEFPEIVKRLRPDLEQVYQSEKNEHVRAAIATLMGTN
jgi:hypothetical protein